jgi:muconolactone delta-isomerase
MQFLTVSRRRTEKFSEAEFAAWRDREVARARALYAEGVVRQIWHRADVGGACILWEAESEQQVREKLDTLPMVNAGMIEVMTVIPLKPYAGFCP